MGHGSFGDFTKQLIERFAPWLQVKVYSRRFEADGITHFSLEETAACDVVILCVAISDYEEMLLQVLPHLKDTSIIVDVATVKKYTNDLLKQHASDHWFVSAHPMFGVESYKKRAEDVSGFRIVLTDYMLPNDDSLIVKNLFSAIGFVVVEMDSDEHDKLLAETLFLTHYIGQSMEAANISRTQIDTVSFSFLMDAVESVINDKALFEDVYRYNPYCKEVAERFHNAQKQVLDSIGQ